MKFEIDPQIFSKFKDVQIGVLIATNISNQSETSSLDQETRKIEQDIRNRFALETLVNHPKIEDWRNAYLAFGAKPKTYKNSLESLMRRVLKPDQLPKINPIVDIYNYISIKHLLPAGGDDLDHVDGTIRLTIAKGGEPFTLLGSRQTETAGRGEVIYRDDTEVLCRRWNWRESDKTEMTSETKNVVVFLEGSTHTTRSELETALDDLQTQLDKYCKGNSAQTILDASQTHTILQ